MSATETVARVDVVRVSAEHLSALAGFYREVWDPTATRESVEASRAEAAAANPVFPGEAPPTWIVLQGGRAIAHVTTIPIVLWLNGEERPAHWIKGLWVLPEFQRSSAGFLVLREAVKLTGAALALVHEPAAIRLFQALGFADIGALPNWLRILDGRALLSRLDIDRLGLEGLPSWIRSAARLARPTAPVAGAMVNVVNHAWSALATGPLRNITVDVSHELDRAGVDPLWRAARGEVTAGPVRGADALARRYERGGEYAFVHARMRGELVGLGIVKRPRDDGDPRLRGIRISTLSDLLYRPSDPRAGLAVIRGAEHAARALGAAALLSSSSASATGALFTRRAHLRIPSNLHILTRVPDAGAAAPPDLDAWWFTRGDSAGDGVF